MVVGREKEVDADDADPALPVFRSRNTVHMETFRATPVVEGLAVAARAAP